MWRTDEQKKRHESASRMFAGQKMRPFNSAGMFALEVRQGYWLIYYKIPVLTFALYK